MIKNILDLYLLDVSVMYFSPIKTSAGAQSRDYYFLYTSGSLNSYHYTIANPNLFLTIHRYLYYFGILPGFFAVTNSDIDNVVPVLIESGMNNKSYFPGKYDSSVIM